MIAEKRRPRVLVLGQTPPPWHGQAVLIEQLVQAAQTAPESVELHHVRMAFSRAHDEIGRMQPRKAAELLRVLCAALWQRARHDTRVLYYPPAGGSLAPVLRDLVLLNLLRPLFSRTVLHFHAYGLAELERELPAVLRPLFRRAYRDADLAIVSSEQVSDDARALSPSELAVIAPSVPDEYAPYRELAEHARASVRAPRVLYVGAIAESKGVLDLIDAIATLRSREQLEVTLELVGASESSAFEKHVRERLDREKLTAHVTLRGVLTGRDKWQMYATSDMHCFPTRYPAETFGLATLEAMSFELPSVLTDFRSARGVIAPGESGLLVPPNDSAALVAALAELSRDAERRRALGRKARQRYLELFSGDRCARAILDRLAHV